MKRGSPSIIFIQTFYPEFLKDIYSAEPDLAERPFDVQCQRLLDSGFSTGNSYSTCLAELGCRTWEIICNADAAQDRWARDHHLKLSDNIHDRRRQIVLAQIEQFAPDVVYVFEWSPLGDAFVSSIRTQVPLVVGEISSTLPKGRTFGCYDLMISSVPQIVSHFRSQGIQAELLPLGFDHRIVKRVVPGPARHDVSFVGGFSAVHPDRIPWLEALLREINVDVYGYGVERTDEHSTIRRHFRGPAWGLDMYRVLSESRITLNMHGTIQVGDWTNRDWANNLRLFEATGVGTCLITDWKPNLSELFELEREVVTYRSAAECIEKTRYYLNHEAERLAIARAGQRRTLRDHTYQARMARLLEILETARKQPRNRAISTGPNGSHPAFCAREPAGTL